MCVCTTHTDGSRVARLWADQEQLNIMRRQLTDLVLKHQQQLDALHNVEEQQRAVVLELRRAEELVATGQLPPELVLT